MSIPGLTDKSKSFREIGRLRKGAPKSEGLVNLRYFRPDFRPGEEAARDLFIQHYGEQPTKVNIRLAFSDIEEVWDAYFTVYTTAGMLGKAGGVPGREGWWWIYLRDNKTGTMVVKDAYPEMKFDPTIPVYSYHSQKNNRDIAVFAKPEGKLKVLIPELNLLNYVTLVTHSWYDIGRISENLAGIKDIASRSGMPLPMVKCVLSRRPEMISCNINGKKSMREEYIINVDVNTDWAGAQLRLLDTIIPGKLLPAPELPALPDGINDAGWDDEVDGDEADEIERPELNPELFDDEPEPETDVVAKNGDGIQYPPELMVVTASDGKHYVDMDTAELSNHMNGILKGLKKAGITEDEKAQYNMKYDVIRQILALRAVKATPGGLT